MQDVTPYTVSFNTLFVNPRESVRKLRYECRTSASHSKLGGYQHLWSQQVNISSYFNYASRFATRYLVFCYAFYGCRFDFSYVSWYNAKTPIDLASETCCVVKFYPIFSFLQLPSLSNSDSICAHLRLFTRMFYLLMARLTDWIWYYRLLTSAVATKQPPLVLIYGTRSRWFPSGKCCAGSKRSRTIMAPPRSKTPSPTTSKWQPPPIPIPTRPLPIHPASKPRPKVNTTTMDTW